MTTTSSEVQEQTQTKVIVPMNDEGRFVYKNQNELNLAARWAIHQKLAPATLIKEGVEAVMTALALCHERNLPYSALQKMFYYKGNITVYGTLFMAMAENHPNYGEKTEFWIDKDYKKICIENKNLGQEWAAVVGVKRKDWKEFTYTHFTLDEAKQAGLYPAMKWDSGKKVESPDSPWNKYTKDMLMWKARVRAYKSVYSESFEGLECYEDVREVIESRDVTPQRDTAKLLNEVI
jgi:hypothetical protein